MATYEVTQPDGHTYRFYRSDEDKMCVDLSASHTPTMKDKAIVEDDGTTTVLPIVPVRGRLRELMGFFGLDGWKLGNQKRG